MLQHILATESGLNEVKPKCYQHDCFVSKNMQVDLYITNGQYIRVVQVVPRVNFGFGSVGAQNQTKHLNTLCTPF